MANSPSLPVELWLEIFRWATLPESALAFYTTEYRPFEYVDTLRLDETKWTKRVLALVCRRWRLWTVPLLYEDITIPRAYLPLTRMLRYGQCHEDGTTIPPCATWVRRVQLPYSSTAVTSPLPIEPVKVLSLCSSVEVLVRTEKSLSPVAYEFDTECPPLPSLKRIDWWHDNEAARTGGINSLPHVLSNAPNLEYLSVGGELWPNFLHTPTVYLPRLATLRVRRVNAFFVLQMCRWSLPTLRHLAFEEFHSTDYWPFWQTFGPQIRTVELGVSLKFYIRDFLSVVLSGCPHLEHLNYYVHCTHVPRIDKPHNSIKTVGLHACSNSFSRIESPQFWSHLRQHLETFTKLNYPALERLELYGNWASVADDEEFEHLVKPLRDRGCLVEMA
ncbi:hypothetical protein BD414DRAFT_414278 [Trametes punicea]|nr:hypothetical protein BD414DRAFT_414278 [Trametes punicea]